MLNQGWSLIDFDDTKTLLICLLIKLLSVSEVYLEPKTKASLEGVEIQYLVERSESPSQGSESSWTKCNSRTESEIKDSNPRG